VSDSKLGGVTDRGFLGPDCAEQPASTTPNSAADAAGMILEVSRLMVLPAKLLGFSDRATAQIQA
jgi:hypothetical protein